MSSYSWEEGLIVKASCRLYEYEPDKYRSIRWYDDHANSISIGYTMDSNHIRMEAIVDGIQVIIDSVYVETEEWNGTDGFWHEFSFELIGNVLYGLRDEKVLFEVTDDLLLNFVHTGFLQISGLGAVLCFDDIVILSMYEPPYVCGDANSDDLVNVSDAVAIINYVFIGGSPPAPYLSGDTNCDSVVNVSDAVKIINYVFIGGSAPCDTDGDSNPDC